MPERVVLDTNVWISAIIKGGKAAKVIDYLETHNCKIFISPIILAEIYRVLDYPRIKKILLKTGKSKIEVLKRIFGICLLIRPQFKLQVIQEDPEDNMFLECAQESSANYLISGDTHLLKLGIFKNTRILSPSAFLEAIGTQSGQVKKQD